MDEGSTKSNPKNRGGRPAHEPTPQTRGTVEMLTAFGVPQEDIARILGVTSRTMRTHYFQEIELGALKANAKVATNLFRIACKESREGLDAAKFWLRMRAGWSEASAPLSVNGDIGVKERRELEANAPPPDEWDGLVRH